MNTKKTLMSFEKDVYQFLINEHKSVVVDNCKKIADYGIAHTVAMLDPKADIYNNCYDVLPFTMALKSLFEFMNGSDIIFLV